MSQPISLSLHQSHLFPFHWLLVGSAFATHPLTLLAVNSAVHASQHRSNHEFLIHHSASQLPTLLPRQPDSHANGNGGDGNGRGVAALNFWKMDLSELPPLSSLARQASKVRGVRDEVGEEEEEFYSSRGSVKWP